MSKPKNAKNAEKVIVETKTVETKTVEILDPTVSLQNAIDTDSVLFDYIKSNGFGKIMQTIAYIIQLTDSLLKSLREERDGNVNKAIELFAKCDFLNAQALMENPVGLPDMPAELNKIMTPSTFRVLMQSRLHFAPARVIKHQSGSSVGNDNVITKSHYKLLTMFDTNSIQTVDPHKTSFITIENILVGSVGFNTKIVISREMAKKQFMAVKRENNTMIKYNPTEYDPTKQPEQFVFARLTEEYGANIYSAMGIPERAELWQAFKRHELTRSNLGKLRQIATDVLTAFGVWTHNNDKI